ncbi:MAG TPA: hypothetical protein VNX29_03085 [Kaistia sp.]|nr:hypothetical protein [Kaistia sp.]
MQDDNQSSTLAVRLADALTPAITAAAGRSGTAISSAELPALGIAVADAIAGDPALGHVVNAEPWYRSRVTWGAIIAALAPLIALLAGHELGADERSALIDIAMAGGSIAGALIALHGRWVAKVPLGSP